LKALSVAFLLAIIGGLMEELPVGDGKVDLEWDDGHVFPPKVYPDVAFLFQRMNKVVVGTVAVNDQELVLDIGCGRALDVVELANRGGRCSGLEPSRKMIEHAREHIASNGTYVSLTQGVSEYLPFKANTFDKIVCKGALDHFHHPGEAIAEMSRVLKPQGKAIIAIANFESLGFKLGRWLLTLQRILLRRTDNIALLQIPDDHTLKFDYTVLKRLVQPHLKIEQSTGISLLSGLPGWSSFLDKLPDKLSLAILKGLDELAGHLPSLSNVIILRCHPRN